MFSTPNMSGIIKNITWLLIESKRTIVLRSDDCNLSSGDSRGPGIKLGNVTLKYLLINSYGLKVCYYHSVSIL